ncbi:hypothetical protein DRH27_04260 [Candidatus Falkowbacteria bacterium]|nr:MAG: hypothetical protein DRH27_04260 [Candidatus Falkowbacteria bacterium]
MEDEKELTSQDSSPEKNDTEEEEEDFSEFEDATGATETSKTSSGESAEGGGKPSSVPYKRFKEVVDERNRLKKQMEGKSQTTPKTFTDEQWKERVDFAIRHRDVSEDEMDFISSYAAGKGISMEEAYKTESIKDYLSYQREKAKQEEAVPEPSSKGETFNKKPLSELSKEEIRENWAEIRDKAIKEGKRKRKKDLGL